MHTVNDADKHSGNEWSGRYLWYFLTIGVVCGAAVIAIAVLPQTIAGLALVAAIVLFGLIDLLARRLSSSPITPRLRRGRGIPYVVIFGVVLVAAFVLDWAIVRRDDALWLAWTMAGVVFVVVAIGTWMVDRRPTDKQPSSKNSL